MATYKVLQDIESEDKLFGPFTLKQFIFGALAIVLAFIGFRIFMLPLPLAVRFPVVLVFLPFILIFGFLAAPLGRDQPNDIWLLGRLRFLFKPRVRIWSQDGVSELVTITAPKQDDHVYTNSFTQNEVESRLNALANTLDSRGWAVKNVNTNLFAQPGYLTNAPSSDRLVSTEELPQEVSNVEVLASDDIFDAANSATAQHLDMLVQQSTQTHKQQAVQQMSQPAPTPQPAQDYYFMNEPSAPQANLPSDYATFSGQQVVSPGAVDTPQDVQVTPEEEALSQKIAEESSAQAEANTGRLKTLQPLHDRDGNIIIQKPEPQPEPAPEAPAPEQVVSEPVPVKPAVANLARNNDLNIATLARQAKKADDGEVTINLH